MILVLRVTPSIHVIGHWRTDYFDQQDKRRERSLCNAWCIRFEQLSRVCERMVIPECTARTCAKEKHRNSDDRDNSRTDTRCMTKKHNATTLLCNEHLAQVSLNCTSRDSHSSRPTSAPSVFGALAKWACAPGVLWSPFVLFCPVPFATADTVEVMCITLWLLLQASHPVVWVHFFPKWRSLRQLRRQLPTARRV